MSLVLRAEGAPLGVVRQAHHDIAWLAMTPLERYARELAADEFLERVRENLGSFSLEEQRLVAADLAAQLD